MKTFTIVDKSSYPVNLQELDKEVCQFWKVERNPEFYATPHKYKIGCSWISVIGNAISTMDGYSSGWAAVVEQLTAKPLGRCFLDTNNPLQLFLDGRTINKLKELIEFYKPYLELIDHFANMGLQPKQIEYVK